MDLYGGSLYSVYAYLCSGKINIDTHGDLLSVFNAMFLGLDAEHLNQAEMFGLAEGVSYMFINNEGKRFIKKISDMSYIR